MSIFKIIFSFHTLEMFLLTLLSQTTTLADQTWMRASDFPVSGLGGPKVSNKTLNLCLNCFRKCYYKSNCSSEHNRTVVTIIFILFNEKLLSKEYLFYEMFFIGQFIFFHR